MLLTYTENSTFYFFSTGAQSIASIVGLSAAIAVFRYQYYLQEIAEKRQYILNLLTETHYLKVFSENDFVAYNKFTSDRERVDWWRKHLKQIDNGVITPEMEKWLNMQIAVQSWSGRDTPAKVEAERKRLFADFKDNYLEYNALDIISSKAIQFRQKVINLTLWGLVLVGFGIVGTLFPAIPACSGDLHSIAKLVFLLGLLVYLSKLLQLIVQAFESD